MIVGRKQITCPLCGLGLECEERDYERLKVAMQIAEEAYAKDKYEEAKERLGRILYGTAEEREKL